MFYRHEHPIKIAFNWLSIDVPNMILKSPHKRLVIIHPCLSIISYHFSAFNYFFGFVKSLDHISPAPLLIKVVGGLTDSVSSDSGLASQSGMTGAGRS